VPAESTKTLCGISTLHCVNTWQIAQSRASGFVQPPGRVLSQPGNIQRHCALLSKRVDGWTKALLKTKSLERKVGRSYHCFLSENVNGLELSGDGSLNRHSRQPVEKVRSKFRIAAAVSCYGGTEIVNIGTNPMN